MLEHDGLTGLCVRKPLAPARALQDECLRGERPTRARHCGGRWAAEAWLGRGCQTAEAECAA